MGKAQGKMIKLLRYLIMQANQIVVLVREIKWILREKFFAPHSIADLSHQ